VLAAGTWIIISQQDGEDEFTAWDFAVEDRSQIHKVVLTKRKGSPLVLEKIDGQWMVNGEREARKNAIDNLLNGLTQVEIRSLPEDSRYENLEKDFIQFSIKVEVFNEEGERIRSYYVGPDSNDGDGTYYLMEGGERFFLMTMPAFHGGMRARFSLGETDWWKHRLMAYNPANIRRIKMHYPRQPQASFVLSQNEEGLRVDPLMENVPKITRPFLKERALNYLKEFKRKGILGYTDEQEIRDSILALQPFAELQVYSSEPDTAGYIFIPRTDQNLKGPNGITQERFFNFTYWLYDPEKRDLMTVQHLQFKDVFRGYDYFFAN
jgi:hypothetical protein